MRDTKQIKISIKTDVHKSAVENRKIHNEWNTGGGEFHLSFPLVRQILQSTTEYLGSRSDVLVKTNNLNRHSQTSKTNIISQSTLIKALERNENNKMNFLEYDS